MYCINGHAMSTGANFCTSCGGQRAPQPQQTPAGAPQMAPPGEFRSTMKLSGSGSAGGMPTGGYLPPAAGYVPPVQPQPSPQQFYAPPPQPQAYIPAHAPAPVAGSKARLNLTPLSMISAILFVISGLLALAASLAPGVKTTNLGNLNAWKLGPNLTACASAKWLVFLFFYSTVIGVLILCRLRISEWAFWLRAGIGVLYLWGGVAFLNYCSNWVSGFNGVATSAHASVAVGPALAIIAGVVYLASAIMMIVHHRSE